MGWIKKNLWIFIVAAIAVVLTILHKDRFWIEILIYIIGMRVIMSKSIPEGLRTALKYAVWIAIVVVAGLFYYVNHHMPHGKMYATGEVVCQNDDRGPCGPEYKEDMRGLDIPNWAKFIRRRGGLILIGLIFPGMVLSVKRDDEGAEE